MATILNAVSGTGLTQTADGSGVMKVQSNGVTTNALAWVNFDGTLTGTITPRANYNISSVTKNGAGDYTLNFTNVLSDANYVVTATALLDTITLTTGGWFAGIKATSGIPNTKTTLAVRVSTVAQNGTVASDSETAFVIFGN